MNKNTKVLQADFDTATSGFTDIIEIYNMDYAPYILKNIYDINKSDLNTNKKNKYIHGFGLSSIYDLCYKYDGICIIEKNELFCISVLLINK